MYTSDRRRKTLPPLYYFILLHRERRTHADTQYQMNDEKHYACITSYFILHASTYETIENVVITLFYEQGTDENYYDFFVLLHTSTAPGFLPLNPGERSEPAKLIVSALLGAAAAVVVGQLVRRSA